MEKVHNNQSGGVATFIIIGIILAALLGGGIYLSKQQGRVASRSDAPSTQQENQPTNQPVANEQNQQNQNTPQQNEPTTGNSGEQTPTPQPNTNSGSANGVVPQVPHTGPSEIAATGSSDIVLPILTISIAAAGVVAYLRSRTTLRVTALK